MGSCIAQILLASPSPSPGSPVSPPQESHLEPPKSFIFPSLCLPLPSLSHSCVSFSLGLSSLPTLIFSFNLFLVSLFQPPCLQCKCQVEMLYLLYEGEVGRSPVSPQTRCLKESQGSGPGAQSSLRDRGRIGTLRFPGRQPLPVTLLESAPPSTWQVVETQLFRKLLSTSSVPGTLLAQSVLILMTTLRQRIFCSYVIEEERDPWRSGTWPRSNKELVVNRGVTGRQSVPQDHSVLLACQAGRPHETRVSILGEQGGEETSEC